MVDDAGQALRRVPEEGQTVKVRGSLWAVSDIREQGVRRSAADDAGTRRQHLVTLMSLAEDHMDEELQVIWELECGQTVLPESGLPDVVSADAFDDPDTLGAFVDAMRWGAVTNADGNAFQSPFRTGARLETYQLEPLRRALSSSRANLLLADDVGLGKTIEAGLVVEELVLRHRARTAVIVCPPSLRVKWQDEMREKFGISFQIVDSQTTKETRRAYGLAVNPFRLYPFTIVSMDWLAQPRAQRLLSEVYAEADNSAGARHFAFDIIVVDEAHHVAPAAPTSVGGGARGYAVDSKRTVAVRELAKRCEHRLFLSATPHNGYSESFTALLEMVDSRRFTRGAQIDRTALGEVTVRRLKTAIKGRGFRQRVIEEIPFEPNESEQERYADLSRLLKDSAAQKGRDKRSKAPGIAALLLQKRFLSSPWSFACTLNGYLAADSRTAFEWEDDYYAQVMGSGQSDEEEGRVYQPEFEALSSLKADGPLCAATETQVRALADWGGGFESRPNGRLGALISWLDQTCRPEGRWNDERVVVFTEYADTIDWMKRILVSRGYDAERLSVIQGSTDADEREMIRARFCADPAEEPLRVLLATDAAGEGIDLQAWCHRLVNFDVPFNPSRLEQRIGRIDRYGQTHEPHIYYFAPQKGNALYRAELEFLGRIVHKVALATDELGSMNPLVDDEIFKHFTGLERHRARTATQAGDENAINGVMAGELQLNSELTRLGRTYQKSCEALHISPQAERRVVDTALALTNQPRLQPGDRPGTYRLPQLNKSWEPVREGFDTVLKPGVYRPLTFDAQLAEGDPGLVYVHLGSKLLAKAALTLRGNLYGQGNLRRVSAVVLPDIDHTCAAAVARLVLVGRGGVRLHEEVFVTGIRFRGANMAEGKVQALLDGALDVGDLKLASRAVREGLAREWEASGGRLHTRLEEAVKRRAEQRQEEVQDSLSRREMDEAERTQGIYAAFAENLRASLDKLLGVDRAQLELDLCTDEQRRQREADVRAIRERLLVLGDEEANEVEGVRERYRDVRPVLNIAALVFAVSEKDARAWEGAYAAR